MFEAANFPFVDNAGAIREPDQEWTYSSVGILRRRAHLLFPEDYCHFCAEPITSLGDGTQCV